MIFLLKVSEFIIDNGSIEDHSPVCTWESNAMSEFVSKVGVIDIPSCKKR